MINSSFRIEILWIYNVAVLGIRIIVLGKVCGYKLAFTLVLFILYCLSFIPISLLNIFVSTRFYYCSHW